MKKKRTPTNIPSFLPSRLGLYLRTRGISMRQESLRGFTLIELLIVIVIIGILSTFMISNFIGIRERARDAQRKTDLRQMQTALQIYYSDQGYFPVSSELQNCDVPFSLGTVTYMKKIPCDPQKSSTGAVKPYIYLVGSATGIGSACNNGLGSPIPCVQYEVIACVENEKDPQIDPQNKSTYCSTQQGFTSFTVTNP